MRMASCVSRSKPKLAEPRVAFSVHASSRRESDPQQVHKRPDKTKQPIGECAVGIGGDFNLMVSHDPGAGYSSQLILTTSNFTVPLGTAISAFSPTFLPSKPWPMGLVTRIFPWS